MSDELPDIFERVEPPPAPRALRPRVLAAVERELARRKKPRWERALELGVAATLLLGIGLNVWQWRSAADWRQRVLDSAVEPATVGHQSGTFAAGDAHLDALIRRRLALFGQRRDEPVVKQYEQALRELTDSDAG